MSYRRIALLTAPAASAAFLAFGLLSCDNADPISPAEAQQPAVQATGPGAGAGSLAAGDSLAVLGPDGVAYSLASGDFPFSTTVSSWQDAFSIKQSGTGRSGQFIVGNPSNTKEALMASHNGSGTALYAIARGTGRAGYYRIDNASNGNGALIGETNGTGAGILAYTTGTGPAANFVVNNAGNSSAALRAETSGTGNLLELWAGGQQVGAMDRDGGLVLVDQSPTGAPLVEGGGTRLLWYPEKSAFRAGYVSGSAWNDAFIGVYSVAVGVDTRATGESAVAMGGSTIASGTYATALGYQTEASGPYGSLAVGNSTTASGYQALASGYGTTASGNQSTALGYSSVASGNFSFAAGHSATASAGYSTAIGAETTASGLYSTALGRRVSANGHTGAFLIGDASTASTNLLSGADNYFLSRFANGYALFTSAALDAGVFLSAGDNSWNVVSDSTRKENYRDVEGEEVLRKLTGMRIQEWNYRSQDPSIRHVGPTAQEFFAAFGLGHGDRSIATVDADGIALRAIQALERRTQELKTAVEAERMARQELERENRALRSRLDRLEAALLDR